MKKGLLYYSLLLLLFIVGCSTGKAPIVDFRPPQKIIVKDYRIEFEKTITTHFTASGTLRIEKKDNYLILYDGHVSSRLLSCLDYSTGKEIWKASELVWRYYFKDGLLVMQYNNDIEMVEIPTGKSIFKLSDCSIPWTHPEGSELADQILVVYAGKDAVLDLKKREIVDNSIRGRFATFTKQKTNGAKVVNGGFLPNNDSLGENFLTANVIEDETGNQLIFIWSLQKSTRTYSLNIYDKTYTKLKEHHWMIPKNNYKEDHDEYFTGLPEPDKLEPSTYVIGHQFFIFENYTRYRWSWGRGNNRLTCIDLKTLEMKYQLWGQSPEHKEYHTFHFFNDIILHGNSTMHFQEGDGTFHQFDKENGEVLDSLQQRFTLFKEYAPGMLLGFNHHRELIKDNIYTNKVTITLWDYVANEFSKAYDFDFNVEFPYEPMVTNDGTIIFTYYDDILSKSVLYCCKVIP